MSDLLFWLIQHFKNALKVLLTHFGLNISLSVVLEINCFQDLDSLRGCRSSLQGVWQPAYVGDHYLGWRWEKRLASCDASLVASFAILSQEASTPCEWMAAWRVTQAQRAEALGSSLCGANGGEVSLSDKTQGFLPPSLCPRKLIWKYSSTFAWWSP